MSRHVNVTSRPARAGVLLTVAAGLALAGAGGGAVAGTRLPAGPAGPPAAGIPAAGGALAGRWAVLPAAPVRRLPAVRTWVWAGGRLIIHGDYPAVTFGYRAAGGRWARLAPGPRPAAVKATDVAVWTGSRMLVMGLTNGSYDPAANTWHRIARPILPDKAAVTAWTGRQVIIWGGTCCGGASSKGQAYDPAAGIWTLLPAAPLQPRRAAAGAWTGRELIVAGGSGTGTVKTFRDGAAWNPATRTWRTIAPMPAGRTGATAVWDGTELILIGGRAGSGAASRLAAIPLAYNPATDRWRWLPKMPYPRSGFGAVWTGRQVLVWGGLTAAGIPPPHGQAYNPAAGRWTALPPAPLRGRADPVMAWTGRRMIVWGGSASGRHFTDGAAFTPPPPGSWGTAIEVPGLGALNNGGDARVFSVSCASAGNCAAGGSYKDRRNHYQGFVAVERNGAWAKAIQMPGPGALNKGGGADVNSVSCASAGNCAAGGAYEDRRGDFQGFVAVERNGVWGTAIQVPGLGALNAAGSATVFSVSCASAGNCAAGGDYTDNHGHGQGFVADERNGVWGQAIQVPGLGALNKGGSADVFSVSCGSPGDCAAGGDYSGRGQGFVADERNGVWGTAIQVPGLAALNTSGEAAVSEVSCASAGNCTAGGYYSSFGSQGFVADERNGVWGTAIEVPGLQALDGGAGDASVNSVSCASAGNCAAGGSYFDDGSESQGFVALERNGVWDTAIEVPGLGDLNQGAFPGDGAEVTSVSCTPHGGCTAGGGYLDSSQNPQGFVASERNGVWDFAIEVPGLGALNKGGAAGVNSVSCAPHGGCAAGGVYNDRPNQDHFQGFVVSQTG